MPDPTVTKLTPKDKGSNLYDHRIDLQLPERANKYKFYNCQISQLKQHSSNTRSHSVDQLESLGRSLSEFGVVRPVLIDEDNTILAGHGIYLALKAMSVSEVPVIKITGLTTDQKRAYLIADNRLAELSAWDNELLEIELSELGSIIDLAAIGFDEWVPKSAPEEFPTQNNQDLPHKCPQCGYEF